MICSTLIAGHSSGGIQNIQTLAEAVAASVYLAEQLGLGPNPTPADLRNVPGGELAVSMGAMRQLDLSVKPLVDGRLFRSRAGGSVLPCWNTG